VYPLITESSFSYLLNPVLEGSVSTESSFSYLLNPVLVGSVTTESRFSISQLSPAPVQNGTADLENDEARKLYDKILPLSSPTTILYAGRAVNSSSFKEAATHSF
jgi:hypothetical protein